jgi:urease accessory protein UreF
MEYVGEEGIEGLPDKASKAAGPWADDLRDWTQALARAGRTAADGPGPSAMRATPKAHDALLRVIHASVMGQDWPMIVRAHQAASRGDWRVVLALDHEWGSRFAGAPGMAEASMRAGQRQLARMRPMRDARVVQRYLEAVESGKARGWHPVVYGLLLAVHSIPLRQGLAHHALQVAAALSRSPRALPAPDAAQDGAAVAFVSEVAKLIPPALDPALKAGGLLNLQPCPA